MTRRLPCRIRACGIAMTVLLLAACATLAVDDAERLSLAGRYEEALLRLEQARRDRPDDAALRTAYERQRERVLTHLLSQAELALAAGSVEQAARLLERASALEGASRRSVQLAQQVQALREQQRASAAATARGAARPAAALPAMVVPGPSFGRPVSLEFRDAPLRQVFEALARSTGVNFVFDKDVRADARVTVFLRGISLDEAMRVILTTQQLDRKLLNESTVLVYPNTPAKQREHQELVTRSIYLVNADPKQALTLVRTMAKTRDLHIDERLGAIVVRDTPAVVDHVEQLIAALDLAEPEVTLAVEVLEVASVRLQELGVQWPGSLSFGLPGAGNAELPLSAPGLRGFVANPLLAAALRESSAATKLLANPTIRARNREKARVQIGEKLPVFTTTAAVNVGVSASVSYLDVGLKLDVEPSVQLDDEVIIKVALEVSNLLREVRGPQGSLAYEVGTRATTTSLRLKDGQTQVLAGLISDQDRRRASGLPGLARAPVVGRLFGVHGDERSKTEIVMLITPRILRRLEPPSAAAATLASGTEAQPGASALRIAPQARIGVPMGSAGSARGVPPATSTAAGESPGMLALAATPRARVGDVVSVTLSNRAGTAARGELLFDAGLLQPAGPGQESAPPGRLPFELAARSETALVLRVLPAAAGRSVAVQASADLPVDGEVTIEVQAAEAPR
jgi:general secretion pathway protein D